MAKSFSVTINDRSTLRALMGQVWNMVCKGIEAGPVVVTLSRVSRSVSQNKKLWPMLNDVSKQVEWLTQDGPAKPEPEAWKDIFTAALYKQQTYPGIDGGFVVSGKSTSKMNKAEFSELIEIIYAFGSEKGVEWSEKALSVYESYKEVQK